MKITDPGTAALQQLKQARQADGAFSTVMREKAQSFYDRYASDNPFQEARLKLRLSVDPSSRVAMDELWKVLFQSGEGVGARTDKLQGWLASNKGLVGWMSGATKNMLHEIAKDGPQAKAIDAAAKKAEDAVAAAFGDKAKDALPAFKMEASTQGAVAQHYRIDIDKMAKATSTLFHPEAKQAFAELKAVMGNPDTTEMQRHGFLREWTQKHPKLGDVFKMQEWWHNLGVAAWSDDRFQRAEQAVKDAFSTRASAEVGAA